MALKRSLFSFTTIALVLALTLTLTKATADENTQDLRIMKKLTTHDAIILSINESNELRRFITSLRSLRSLDAWLGGDEDKARALLFDCQDRLNSHLDSISNTLGRLLFEDHVEQPALFFADTHALQESVNIAVGLGRGEACQVDSKFVTSLGQRRLQDFSQTISDLVQLLIPTAQAPNPTPCEGVDGHGQP